MFGLALAPFASGVDDADNDYNAVVREFPWTQQWFQVDLSFSKAHICGLLHAGEEKADGGEGGIGGKCCCERYLYFLAHREFIVHSNIGDILCWMDPVHDCIPISPLLLITQYNNGQESSCCTIWLDGGELC